MRATQAVAVALLTCCALVQAADPVAFTLAREGRPAATIVTAKAATVAANLAALELQAHIRQITGATLPIVADDVPVTGARILVGESAATRALHLSPGALKYQEYLVQFTPDALVLLGRDDPTTVAEGGFPRAAGKFGRALACDGEKTALMVGDPGFSDEAGTMEAWVWMPAEAPPAKHGTILRLDGDNPWTYHIVQRDMKTSSISYVTYDGKAGRGIASGPLAEGWHHVVATHDLAAAKMELFIDGKSVGTAPYVKTTCSRAALGIGGIPSDTGPTGNPFRGLIDEVRLSRVVRAPADCAGGPYALDADTTVLYHFDEDRGEPVNAARPATMTGPLPGLFDDRGTLDATYEFLERYCEVRWYAPTEIGTVCPRRATLVVRGPGLRRAPDMIHRWITPTAEYMPGPPDTVPARDLQLWKLRMRIGGRNFWVCHSFYGYYDRFLKDHPDWFAQGYGTQQPPQMCYTNPEFIAQVVQDARDYFDGKGAKPGATAAGDVFGLVPMDNNSWCKCPRCQAEMNQAQRSNQQFNNGKASDYIFSFVNKVAREVRKTHPHKWIGALAYSDYAYYPQKCQVEPNVIVQTCLHTRNWWCPSMEVNDRKVLDEWRRNCPDRPLYLWLYYCFPALNAQSGSYAYFPGYFAHTVVKQMKWYHARGVQGIFMEHSSECGQSYLMDQLEFYVTLKLADDPALDGDKLIEEFFTRYYGAAARPMRELYLRIEDTFSNPKYYPVEIQQSLSHQHQNETLAWGSLGTEQRMAEFQKLMDRAKAAAQRPEEKERVALFERGQWDYMVEGRRRYLSHLKGRAQAPPEVQVPRVADARGDCAALDWSQVKQLGGWGGLAGDATGRRLETRVAHDGRFLYVQLSEQLDPAALVAGGQVFDGDDWELFFAPKRNAPYRQLCVGPTGRSVAIAWRERSSTWESAAAVTCDRSAGRWTARVALPLDKLVPGGVQPGGACFANFYRASPGASNLLAWTPTFAGGFHDTSRLAQFTLQP